MSFSQGFPSLVRALCFGELVKAEAGSSCCRENFKASNERADRHSTSCDPAARVSTIHPPLASRPLTKPAKFDAVFEKNSTTYVAPPWVLSTHTYSTRPKGTRNTLRDREPAVRSAAGPPPGTWVGCQGADQPRGSGDGVMDVNVLAFLVLDENTVADQTLSSTFATRIEVSINSNSKVHICAHTDSLDSQARDAVNPEKAF